MMSKYGSVITQASCDNVEGSKRSCLHLSSGRRSPFSLGPEKLKVSNVNHFKQPEHKYPRYESVEERELSFNSAWKHPHQLTATCLAKAGFFYEGHSDAVRCFSCGLGIRGWEEHNDPVEEHVYLTDECPFLEDKMGEDKFQEMKKSLTKIRNPNQSPEPERHSYYRDFENDSRYGNLKGNISEYQTAEKPTTLGDLEKDTEKLRKNLSCKGCGKVGSNVLFLNCGHMLYCMACASSVRTCLKCGNVVQKVLKVYMS